MRVAGLAVLGLLAIHGTASATCAYSHVEVRGKVVEFGGEPVPGASVLAFMDRDSRPVFELDSERESVMTDAGGSFVLRGVFVDYAWPRWWHRWSKGVDVCGREPRSLSLLIQKGGFSARRTVLTADSDEFSRVAERHYLVEIRQPIELLRK